MRIMQTSLRFNMCNLSSSYDLDEDVDTLKSAIEESILNIVGLEYACRYWTSHIVKVPGRCEDSWLFDALREFSQEKVLFYIEVMNLFKAKESCCLGIDAVLAWIDTAVSTLAFLAGF